MPEKIAANVAAGITRSLAYRRSDTVSSLSYAVFLNIPASPAEPVHGRVSIDLELPDSDQLPPVDFLQQGEVSAVRLNGASASFEHSNSLLTINSPAPGPGANSLEVEFSGGGAGLRRRTDLVYSLFVPAKAHTVFPCFDQPDMKARFRLELTLPESWLALSNTAELSCQQEDSRRIIRFAETGLLPTYLFAFVAGRAGKHLCQHNGRQFQVFAPETSGLAESGMPEPDDLDAILQLHTGALAWLEDYTGIPYPFSQLGLALIPDFEFGGMEHPGAVYYRSQLLLKADSENRRLRRAHLIAHETAHMWFGNYVTMRWFDDVWLKEVFANHLADRIVATLFPDIDHALNSLLQHQPPARAIDRTAGTHPVRESLDSLAEAGELYDAIIYHKAPIAMQHLEDSIGEERLQQGLRVYLQRFADGNASWPDLLAIMEQSTGNSLEAFSRNWIETAGYPVLAPLSNSLPAEAINDNRRDRFAYGAASLDETDRYNALQTLKASEQPVDRARAWLTLYEDLLEGGIDPAELLTAGIAALHAEPEALLIARLTTDLSEISWRYLTGSQRAGAAPVVERALWTRSNNDTDGASWLIALSRFALTPESLAELQAIWKAGQFRGARLSSDHLSRLALYLAVTRPDEAPDLLAIQAQRLASDARVSADTGERFALLQRTVFPDADTHDRCFRELTDQAYPALWTIEAVGWLNHPLQAARAHRFIEPGIVHAQSLRDAGELFLPRQWLTNLFSGHNSDEAAEIISAWLEANAPAERFRQLLQQTADPVFRAVRLRQDATRERLACP